MITDTRVATAASARASGYRYVRSDKVAAVSVRAARGDTTTPVRTVLQACVARFQLCLGKWLRALPRDRVLLFAATPLSSRSDVPRDRGIWGSDDLRWLPPTAARSASVEVAGERGDSRLAGFAEVGAAFFEAADFVRTHETSFLLVSSRRELTEGRVRSMEARAFRKRESSVDWGSVVALVLEGEDICIRASSAADEREASLDAFLSDALLEKLGAP